MLIDQAWVDHIRRSLPELPDHRRQRYIEELGLPEYDASLLTETKELADYFEECVRFYPNPKTVSNWIMGDLSRLMNTNAEDISSCRIKPEQLGSLLQLIDQGTISGKIAKGVFEEMFATGKSPEVIVKEKGLLQISDEGVIAAVVDEVLANNPESVEDFKAGKEKAIGFLVGQVMKATKGKANPGLVNRLLKEKLQ